MIPSQRWSELEAADAWDDCLNKWTNLDQPLGYVTFTALVADTLHEPEGENCGLMDDTNNCGQTVDCVVHDGSGAAAYAIYNSLIIVHEVSVASFGNGSDFFLANSKLNGD
jgi:hypothetical protein